MGATQYFEHYKSKGFNFSNKVLSKYCLSLYTKPFLILSGISGTGKTKIAQLFETFVDEAVKEDVVMPSAADEDYVILKVNESAFTGRGNFKFKDLASIFEPEDIPEIQEKIAKIALTGSSENVTEPEIFDVHDPEHGDFKIGVYLQRASSPLLRVRFTSKRGDADKFDSTEFLKEHYNEGDTLSFKKVAKRKLQLVSKNDENIIKVEDVLDKVETELVNNKLFVSVKSNWTDNSELFGYYNILEEKYNITPVLKFIMTAQEYPLKPFFLILDEMNLSKVEHYFSDFLSCLESRIIDDGKLKQEAIRLHNYSSFAESNDNYYDLVPDNIDIPLNLYVTGTVNIDETTYSFSPKVLDRANVIEFNEVSVASYEDVVLEENFTLKKFPDFGIAQVSTSTDFKKAPNLYKECVSNLLSILQPYNLHFGYRVINEMASFINNSIYYIDDTEAVINDAIDIQISQKVLPKFNGSFGKLDEPLRKLIAFMLAIDGVTENDINLDYVLKVKASETKYPDSLAKLSKLYINAVYNGFASYLE
jgi:hypothetical protein